MKRHQGPKFRDIRELLTWRSNQAPHSARCGCQMAKSNPRLCATRNSSSSTSVGSVLGIWAAYESSEIGLFVVFVARNRAVNLFASKQSRRHGVFLRLASHNVLWVPIHHSVHEIKPFDVCNCRRLDFLREAEVATQLNYFGQVVSDQQKFFLRAQKRHILR